MQIKFGNKTQKFCIQAITAGAYDNRLSAGDVNFIALQTRSHSIIEFCGFSQAWLNKGSTSNHTVCLLIASPSTLSFVIMIIIYFPIRFIFTPGRCWHPCERKGSRYSYLFIPHLFQLKIVDSVNYKSHSTAVYIKCPCLFMLQAMFNCSRSSNKNTKAVFKHNVISPFQEVK